MFQFLESSFGLLFQLLKDVEECETKGNEVEEFPNWISERGKASLADFMKRCNCWWCVHHRVRNCFYTPMKVNGGPISSPTVGDCRISLCSTPHTGRELLIVDDWKYSEDPHATRPGCGFFAFVSWEAMSRMRL